MKWFKHMTNSSLDERLARFTDKYGLEAYGFFWRVLEAIAENVDETDRKRIEYSTKTWCKLLGIRPQTFRKLIQESSVLGLFQVSFNSDLVSVESPNILKYRDEWTRKKSKTPEQNSEKEKEKEPEIEQKKSPQPPQGELPTVPPSFDRFWAAYPNKVGKDAARKAWEKAKGKPKIDELLAILDRQKTWPKWRNDNGRYIPNPSTWINQGRWNDEPPQLGMSAGCGSDADDMEAAMERVRQRNERLKAAERGEVA